MLNTTDKNSVCEQPFSSALWSCDQPSLPPFRNTAGVLIAIFPSFVLA